MTGANGPSASFEEVLVDPSFQTPLDTEILPNLLAFGPPDQHVHGYTRQNNGTTACRCGEVLRSNTAAAWPSGRAGSAAVTEGDS